MSKESIYVNLEHIISTYIHGVKFEPNNDLMGDPVFLSAHEMADLFLSIEKEFSIDLNDIVTNINTFSFNAIAEKIIDLYETN